jgi:hypothetical protein
MKTFKLEGIEYTVKDLINGERIVEVPMLEVELLTGDADYTLEIGNVSYHHLDFSWYETFGEHTVVDLHEQAPNNPLNVDIVDYKPNLKFNKIVSVSTFEHVDPRNSADKMLRAWDNIIENCLADDGDVWFTVPCSWNKPLIEAMLDATFFTTFLYGMKRTGKFEWEQCSPIEAAEQPYGKPGFARANGILIGEYYK